MKKSILIWLAVIASVAVVLIVTSVSLAIWQENDHDLALIKTPIVDENPSIKYQIYVPVTSSGYETSREKSAYNKLAGTLTFSGGTYRYTLASGSVDAIEGFALVGWYGGVAYEVLNIPEEVTVTVNNTEVTAPVVRLMVDSSYTQYNFSGENTVINKIIVGGNVTEVDKGFFQGMPYLSYVKFAALSEPGETVNYLYLREYCLAGCPLLNVVDSERSTADGWDTTWVMYESGTLQ